MTCEENGAVEWVDNPGAGVKAPIKNIEDLRYLIGLQISELHAKLDENTKLSKDAYDAMRDLSYKAKFVLSPEGYAKLCNPLDFAEDLFSDIRAISKAVHEPEITKICDSIIKEIRDFS